MKLTNPNSGLRFLGVLLVMHNMVVGTLTLIGSAKVQVLLNQLKDFFAPYQDFIIDIGSL